MKIVATSDLHGSLPRIDACDLLIIAGDVLPLKSEHALNGAQHWLNRKFRRWLEQVPADTVVGIAGNHDFFFERDAHVLEGLELPWIYLRDELTVIGDLALYGLPWVPNLPRWAFHADPHKLALAYQAVPEGTNIVISHGPPKGELDNGYGTPFAGQMIDRISPALFICGHVHEGYGHQRVGSTDVCNVSHNNIVYEPVNAPVTIEL